MYTVRFDVTFKGGEGSLGLTASPTQGMGFLGQFLVTLSILIVFDIILTNLA